MAGIKVKIAYVIWSNSFDDWVSEVEYPATMEFNTWAHGFIEGATVMRDHFNLSGVTVTNIISKDEFESMHPRFSAVNMYRRMCERENIEFKMNLTVDNIGIALEKPYDDARTS